MDFPVRKMCLNPFLLRSLSRMEEKTENCIGSDFGINLFLFVTIRSKGHCVRKTGWKALENDNFSCLLIVFLSGKEYNSEVTDQSVGKRRGLCFLSLVLRNPIL